MFSFVVSPVTTSSLSKSRSHDRRRPSFQPLGSFTVVAFATTTTATAIGSSATTSRVEGAVDGCVVIGRLDVQVGGRARSR